MDTNISTSLLAYLTRCHVSKMFAAGTIENITAAPAIEFMAYSYGVLAGYEEEEAARASRKTLLDHEGYNDVETLGPFWRGVIDQLGKIGYVENKQPRARATSISIYRYPYLRVSACSYTLSRLYDYLRNISPYPQAANQKMLEHINDRPGCPYQVTGVCAQMIVAAVYDGANIGRNLDIAREIYTHWIPERGQGVAYIDPNRIPPQSRDLSHLRDRPEYREIDRK